MADFEVACKECEGNGWIAKTVMGSDGEPELDRDLCDACRASGIAKNFHVFLDLDGVLVNFEKGVKDATGYLASTLNIFPESMWNMLSNTKDFYTDLEWLKDGELLWEFFKGYKPIVITGLPLGDWAEPQKREWCRKNLGDDVEVICCLSEDKQNFIRDGYKSLLIDDRLSNCEAWKAAGGSALHHENYYKTMDDYFHYFIEGACTNA